MPLPSRIVESTNKLYYVYTSMMARCYNPNKRCWKDYGGRGISVCFTWRNNRDTFFVWALRSGYQEGMLIDRENNDGNYTPRNCRWVNRVTSSRNRRSAKLTLADACVIKDLCSIPRPNRSGLQQLVAALYGIDETTVAEIKRGDIWKDANPLTAVFEAA